MNSYKRKYKRTMAVLVLILGSTLLSSCYATPTVSDVERVKEQFLILRFRLALSPEKSQMGDRELFEMSCRNNRVKCGEVLEILKKEDSDFYTILMKEWKKET